MGSFESDLELDARGSSEPAKKISAFLFDPDSRELKILDQTLLPKDLLYVSVPNSEVGYAVIKKMLVRGAPCIAAVGCLSLIAELNHPQFLANEDGLLAPDDLIHWLNDKSQILISARPTAVNLKNALGRLIEYAVSEKNHAKTCKALIGSLTNFCLKAIEGGQTLNKRLGDYGAEELIKNRKDQCGLNVLTHCNTGALATVGYGTALGVIRSLHSKGALGTAYCTETRPYNQGSRLTAWEFVQEEIPATLVADSMVAYLISTQKIDAVLVGADCVASNGDTANKIGTLQIAVVAKHYGVPFYVAAPTQSIDLSIENQNSIRIEQRPASEMRRIDSVILAPDEIKVWNPCFDVTPAGLITGIITEIGVIATEDIKKFLAGDENKLERNEDLYALF